MTKEEAGLDARDAGERRVLMLVLAINLAQAFIVGAIGFYADSTGLIGAGLDNLADAGVYAVSLYAVGRSLRAKAFAARLSGTFLMLLAGLLLAEVARRFFTGAEPVGLLMIVTALLNAGTNLLVMRLLRSRRNEGVHLKASWIFTGNDMVANAGIVVSGIAVMLLHSAIPDLLIGLVVVAVGFRGGWEILEHARQNGDRANSE